MATPPDAVRSQLALVTANASADLLAAVAPEKPASKVAAALEILPALVPAYYDAAGALAVSWYDEIRDESRPSTVYTPSVIGVPSTDWIEREVAAYAKQIEATTDDLAGQLLDEMAALAQKEVARGFRLSIVGNTADDQDALGWSRVARAGACKFCLMLAGKGAVYRSESSAIFAAHKHCNCAARPEFRGGHHGPEASAIQYVASARRAKSDAVQARRNAAIRDYLNKHYPDAPG